MERAKRRRKYRNTIPPPYAPEKGSEQPPDRGRVRWFVCITKQEQVVELV